ncbi:MAG: sulfite exporter TauE/SafE family protein [Coraliomargaritaceae bacterium]
MPESILLVLLCFGVALLYAAVGHGGASGYLAVMTLLSVAPESLRPTALALNVGVSLLGTITFFRAGSFRGSLFWPLALCALPAAYFGGGLSLDHGIYRRLLGLILFFGFIRLVWPVQKAGAEQVPSRFLLLITGVWMGFLSGLIGVGGGIFLTPLAIFLGWAKPREAAALSAPFIFLNSLAGLAGLEWTNHTLHNDFLWLIGVVLVAGWIGSYWGSHLANSRQIRFVLGCVLALASAKLLFS